jgi:hypothetical protein
MLALPMVASTGPDRVRQVGDLVRGRDFAVHHGDVAGSCREAVAALPRGAGRRVDACALAGEPPRGGAADAGGGSGDDGLCSLRAEA